MSGIRVWFLIAACVPLSAGETATDAAPAVPARTATIELEIGEVDGGGPATFGRISGL